MPWQSRRIFLVSHPSTRPISRMRSLFHLISAGRWVYGRPCSMPTSASNRILRKVRSGTAAPISLRPWLTAVNVTRRAILRSRSITAKNSAAHSPPVGARITSAVVRRAASVLGMTRNSLRIWREVMLPVTDLRRVRWAKRWTKASANWHPKTSTPSWRICAAFRAASPRICPRPWLLLPRTRTKRASRRQSRVASRSTKAPASAAMGGAALAISVSTPL